MKILELDLRAYGPFTDVRLDLSGGKEGLHLIHGANEAGKSSTMRALSAFLFGIPGQTDDDFIHEYKAMRVGGTLRDRDGRTLSALRLKKREKTLEGPDGSPVADAELTRILGRLTQSAFEKQFRINHADLRSGGDAMTRENGEVSQALFAAGSGLSGVRKAMSKLDSEIESLFKPKGQNQAINASLASFEQIRSQRDKIAVLPADWSQEYEKMQRIGAELATIDERFKCLNNERRNLERILRTLPIAARIVEMRERLSEFGTARVLSDGFSARRARAQAARNASHLRRDQAVENIQRLRTEIEGLTVPDDLIAESEAVSWVGGQKAGYLKGLRAQDSALDRLRLRESDARAVMAELRPGLPLEQAETMQVRAETRATIRRLGLSYGALAQTRDQAAARVRSLAANTADVDPNEARRRLEGVERACKSWQGLGAIDDQLIDGQVDAEAQTHKAQTALKRLTRWTGTLEALEELAAPSNEAVDHASEAMDKAERLLIELDREIEKASDELQVLEGRIEVARLSGELPTEADLVAARTKRDTAWGLIRPIVTQNERPDADSVQRLAEQGSPVSGRTEELLASVFEQAIGRTDDLADRLRREAERVHNAARLLADRDQTATVLADRQARREKAELGQTRAKQAWVDLWKPLGIEPGSVKEMRAWLKEREGVLQLIEAAQAQKAQIQALSSRRDAACREARTWLERLGEPATGSSDSLASLIGEVASAAKRLTRAIELAEAREVADEAARNLDDWQAQWGQALAPTGLGLQAQPAEADNHLERVDLLFSHLKEIEDTRLELARLERESREYVRTVQDLAATHGIADPTSLIENQAAELVRRLEAAQKDDARRSERQKALANAEDQHARALEEIARAEQDLAALRIEAGIEADSDDFEGAESRSSEVQQLRNALATDERHLIDLADGLPLQQMIADAQAADRDEIKARLDELETLIAPLSEDRDRLNRDQGESRLRLQMMDGGSSAAEAEQEAQALLSRIGNDAERYARFKLGKALLDRAMKRYREKNEGAVLRRAGEIFAGLTLGGFTGIRLDENDEGKSLLVGIRAGNRPVEPREMSDGTADALYLALRIATLEVEFDAHGPVPFVVDDILINLDNRRATAALEALAALSKRTQVLLFTHHEHLVDLARERLVEPGLLFIHDLPDPMTRPA